MSNALAKVGHYEREIRQLKSERSKLKKLLAETIDLAEEANGDPSACLYNELIGERLEEIRKEIQ